MKRRNLLECLSDNIVVDKDKCTTCGICVDTCVMDNLRMKLSPCRQACPLGVNCQGYVQLIARGEEEKAMEMLQEVLPFPGILGRICSHPCEESCQHRKIDGEAVSIRALKRYLADQFVDKSATMPDMAADSGKKVAVIGSGPAGMMAAYDLRVKGYAVTVYEAEKAPGGMLRWGIPEFRLPLNALDREISLLEQMGVVFECGTAIGKDKSVEALKQEYEAVIVATGCPQHAKLNQEGEDLPGIFHGLPFLRDVRAGKKPEMGNKVVVIGGGNVAVDAAQTALRLGAADVTMVCLESEKEVPAIDEALAGARSEGIQLKCSWGNPKFSVTDGVLTGVEFVRCTKVFDDCGKFSPCFDSSESMTMDADTVIVAIGQRPDVSFIEKIGQSLEKIKAINPLTLQTTDEMMFMAGDVVTGPSSVIGSMAKGRCAAESVHRFLAGEHLTFGRAYEGPIETDYEIDTGRGNGLGRSAIPEKSYAGKGDFGEIEMTFDQETARKEAGRCYSCGQPFGKYRTCWFCLPCEVECPNEALHVEIPYLAR